MSIARDYLEEYPRLGDALPTIEGLADHLGISYSTLYRWLEDESKAEFWEVVERLKTRQARQLINGGLRKEFAERTTGMLLAKHGYSGNTTVELGNKDGKALKQRIEITHEMPIEVAMRLYREKLGETRE